jgi:hypothetical protein
VLFTSGRLIVKCQFIFCLHNHQPVGNFEHVFEWAFNDCYNKTIEILKEYPEFTFAIHHSGPLLEWIIEHSPEYIDTIRMMVERGQVEIIGGGFYEPIFSIISEEDIRGQIKLLQDFCKDNFGRLPRGFWTAERVWDPEIPRLVSGFDFNYTILDDNHFRYAGIEEDDLYGYYITERLNYSLKVFPIDKFLRYSIPFKLPEETINYFKEKAERLGDVAFVYGDDGEKFGVWPGTSKWVFEEKWLVNFVESILKNDWIKMTHPSDLLEANPPKGRVYLTQGSYYELSEWALPPVGSRQLMNLHREIEEWGRGNDFYPFLKGGVWNNFLNKYPESNAINKRTLLLSKEIADFEKKSGQSCDNEKIELYKGECNCAYWHGLFGGIYLGNLRHALYEHVLGAEGLLLRRMNISGIQFLESDYWNEGQKQILIRKSDQSTVVVPYLGGTISELGLYDKSLNLFNVISRRYESYHDDLREVGEDDIDSEKVESIHTMSMAKEKGLENYLVYDNSRRYSFKDIFARYLPSVDDIMYNRAPLYDSGSEGYVYSINSGLERIDISLEKRIDLDGHSISLLKKYILSEDYTGIRGEYLITGGRGLFFGVELNLNLLSERDDKRYFNIDGVKKDDSYLSSLGMQSNIKFFSMVDAYLDLKVGFKSSLGATLLWHPVYTVSQSDRGFEKNFQGTAVILFYEINEERMALEVSIEIE